MSIGVNVEMQQESQKWVMGPSFSVMQWLSPLRNFAVEVKLLCDITHYINYSYSKQWFVFVEIILHVNSLQLE